MPMYHVLSPHVLLSLGVIYERCGLCGCWHTTTTANQGICPVFISPRVYIVRQTIGHFRETFRCGGTDVVQLLLHHHYCSIIAVVSLLLSFIVHKHGGGGC